MSRKTQGNLILLLTAVIWGTGFVSSSMGMQHLAPLTFNMFKNLVGSLVLIPVIFLMRRGTEGEDAVNGARRGGIGISIRGGVYCGLVLGVASAFQQAGLSRTTVGKSAFITVLYIVIVPLLGLFMRRKVSGYIWMCVGIATIGFYFLSIKRDLSISFGDVLSLFCAFFYSLHIVVVDRVTGENTDNIIISCVQSFIAGLVSMMLMILFEHPTLSDVRLALPAIIFAGGISSGIGFTLQVVGQARTTPAIASLIMSLESVFAALFGWIILREVLSPRELVGCALVFAAVILSQLPRESCPA